MTGFVEVKTSGLTGAALDWVVAQVEKVEGLVIHKGRPAFERDFDPDCWADETDLDAFKCWQFYTPSTDWSQGGPLIDKRQVNLHSPQHSDDCWAAWVTIRGEDFAKGAYQPLVAACRAIVASVLGDTVSVPKELLK